MSAVRAIRQSNLARLGMSALVVLLYIIYVVGKLLEFGLVGPIREAPVVEITGASAGLIIGLLLIHRFFQRNVK